MSFHAMKSLCLQKHRELEEKAGAGVATWEEYLKLVARIKERKYMITEIDEMIEARRKRGDDADE